jgi:hypothetical protein
MSLLRRLAWVLFVIGLAAGAFAASRWLPRG